MLTATYKLDLVPGGIPLVIPVSQYDVNSRVFSLELTSSGGEVSIPITASAAIRGTKPDGNGFDYAASGTTISGDTVTVSITLTAQMTAIAGRVPCEIYLYTGTPPTTANPDGVNYVQLATANFILQVKPAALDKDTLKSDSEIRQLVDVIDRTDELLDAVADIETAYADYSNKAVFYAEAQTLTDAQKATARENIGAADDDDLTALENTVNVELAGKADAAATEAALAGKVNVAQGSAQAGKALVVGEDGNVTTGEAGIPDAVKTALLELLEHVAYVDGQGQTLYDALSRALESDYYNTWLWKLSGGQFEVAQNTSGYLSDSQQIIIGNAASNNSRRRHIRTLKGIKPFKDGSSDADTVYYPIPIPPTANRVTITVTPTILVTGYVCRLSGSVFSSVYQADSVASPCAFCFDPATDQVLVCSFRVDVSNTEFSPSTEPQEIVIEFEMVDDHDMWRWTLTGDDLEKLPKSGGYYEDANGFEYVGGDKQNRRFICALTKTKAGYVHVKTAASGDGPWYDSQYYPIIVPSWADKVKVTTSPASIEANVNLGRLITNGYENVGASGWTATPMEWSFAPGSGQAMVISMRVNSSNANFTSANEPTEIVVEFKEA